MIQNISFCGKNYFIPANKSLYRAPMKEIVCATKNAIAKTGDSMGCKITTPKGMSVTLENIRKFNPEKFDENELLNKKGYEAMLKMFGLKKGTFGEYEKQIKLITECNTIPNKSKKPATAIHNYNCLG